MPAKRKQIESLPEYFRHLRPDSSLTSREIADLYGITPKSLRDRVERGTFPKPDWCQKGSTKRFTEGDPTKPVKRWRVSTVLPHFIKEHAK